MEEALKKHHISFKNAWAGVVWVLRTQPNFRIHLILSFLALALSVWFGVSGAEFSIIIFTIVLGLGAEMINTSLESITDLVTTEWKHEAKIAKDVSAGMMLVIAFGAAIVGIVILGPYILGQFYPY